MPTRKGINATRTVPRAARTSAGRPVRCAPVRSRLRAVSRKSTRKLKNEPAKKRILHPYIRTMFLSLAAGTIGVIGSTIYYVHVAEATKPFLEARAVLAADVAPFADTPFVEFAEETGGEGGENVMLRPPPKEYLRERAAELGYDATLLERIAYCESRWRMVKNRTSSAYGYFQIIDGTERMTPQYKAGFRKTDPYANIEMALSLYGKQGTLPWLASRRCWSR